MDRTFRRAFRSYLSEVETTRGSTDRNEIDPGSMDSARQSHRWSTFLANPCLLVIKRRHPLGRYIGSRRRSALNRRTRRFFPFTAFGHRRVKLPRS
jgi:hypothetical protein